MKKDDNTLQYHSFFAAIKHTEADHLFNILMEYNIGTYIIAREIANGAHEETQGEHFHFVVEMSTTDYHKYAKRIFKDKYKLRGQASKGKPRQYGKVKQIENIEKMKAYVMKDDNYTTNMKVEEIKKLTEIAFKKDEVRSKREELIEQLTNRNICRNFIDDDYHRKHGTDELILRMICERPTSRYHYWVRAAFWLKQSEDNHLTTSQIDNIIDWVVTYKNDHTIEEIINIRKNKRLEY